MKKRIIEVGVLAGFMIVMLLANNKPESVTYNNVSCIKTAEIPLKILQTEDINEEQEEIRNEIFYGELEELAILIQAESGNQDELGKRYVADVVLNRVDSDDFPDSINNVLRQDKQFSSIIDGNYAKAEWTVTEDCFQIALEEYENRTNPEILYFRTDRYGSGTPAFKHGDHYFSTR
jgi:spore germination cell wall hydrolase CwlJ-like protein